MPDFRIIPARPFHCGMMVRRLRAEHAIAADRVGQDAHRELRAVFEQSSLRRALMIDGSLAGLGGVTGGLMAATGFVWLALTQAAIKYPTTIVRLAQRQLREIMATRIELATTVLGGDEAALRLAVFLGFHVEDDGPGAAACSRSSRAYLKSYIESCPDLRHPVGAGYYIALGYHAANHREEAA